jgi:hypothetical protein
MVRLLPVEEITNRSLIVFFTLLAMKYYRVLY